MDISGARVLITGASRGIGAAMAGAFASEGAKVALVARSGDELQRLADEYDGKAYQLDLGRSADLDGFIDRVEADGGPIDILINNAGIETSALVEELDEDHIEQLSAVNLVAPMRLTRQVLPGMLERRRGHVVFTSSVAASTPAPGLAAYCASKAGLTRFSESLRIEMRDSGIGVTTLHLGPVDTGMWERVTDHPAFDVAQTRFRRFKLLVDVSPELVAADTVDAVTTNKREVRHPKRLSATMSLAAAPGRLTEVLLAGITPRDHRR